MIPEICPYRSVCKEYRIEGIMCNFTIGNRVTFCTDYQNYRNQTKLKHKPTGLAKLFDFGSWFK